MSVFPKQMDTWQETVAVVQQYRDNSLDIDPPLSGIPLNLPSNVSEIPRKFLSAIELDITETPPEHLLEKLASGELSSVAVTQAFLRRAALAQRLTNCLTELLPRRALARAKELDDHLSQHGKPIGPLHGLPVSIKEQITLADHPLNYSYVSWVDNVPRHSAYLIDLLETAGAVIHARTTQPQLIMHLECASNLYGTTVNPFNCSLTSGGSSGGEGALLALKGSALGVGTDIGGSVRSPAANCGVWALRPTTGRVPMLGIDEDYIGQEAIRAVAGPMSTSFEGLRSFMRAVLRGRKPELKEPGLIPLGWRDDEAKSHFWSEEKGWRLKIGVMWDDGVVKPHPPVQRALRELVEALKEIDGVEIRDWEPYHHDQAWSIAASLYFPDGGADEERELRASGEPWLPLSRWIVKDNPFCKELGMHDLWDWTAKREQYRIKYASRWLETATGDDERGVPTGMVDVLLCPAGPGAAPPLENSKYWGYLAQWNVLDYPAAVFPVTTVDKGADKKDQSYRPRNEQDAFNHELYEPERYTDAPVGLQLVGRIYEDEKVLAALDFISSRIQLPLRKAT
ncbi:putative glutamyl-tRNA amidotransferase subunit A [Eremomyces bilateralis CBS 781.70]|uniref:amidase n=1 Tax=Eremomyces bilateralis CBS 781.70 TaxID=1392243 RepID=A0A6G1FXM9_9PEZI|nr:putative glutamyl-tRNA amidotransferase subunit A [Eremomyces bilateralis CBS 781.70]KAF1810440.1 putative glutamyl-tRNA amidotransferase subunit A [Eremomyces bilateralis CBS 781.70]